MDLLRHTITVMAAGQLAICQMQVEQKSIIEGQRNKKNGRGIELNHLELEI